MAATLCKTTIYYPFHNSSKLLGHQSIMRQTFSLSSKLKVTQNKQLIYFFLDQRCNSSIKLQARCFSQTFSSPNDPNQETRRKKLTFFTYLSCMIGVCLLSVIGFDQYRRMAKKAIGIEEIKIREYGRRAHLHRYRGFVFPPFIINDVKSIHEFDIGEDDIWIASFPKAGTTWVQEIVYLINSELDFDAALSSPIDERCPYFEWPVPGLKAVASLPYPRLIKTHLPFSLLPKQVKTKKPKIIYVMRNPKDTAVSFYKFAVDFLSPVNKFHGSFERYCELFTEDLVPYGPWWKHVLEAWARRHDHNVFLISYEELSRDLPQAIRRLADFLGRDLDPQQVERIAAHCSFNSMQQNPSVNYSWLHQQGLANPDVAFMRKGQVGGWREALSEETAQRLDEMVSERLAPKGLFFQDNPDNTSPS